MQCQCWIKNENEKIYIARLTRLMLTLRVIGSIGIVWTLIPMYAPPLSKAACPDEGTILPVPKNINKCSQIENINAYISGSVMPLTALAQSRYVFTAMTIDSVPPEVVVPAPLGLLYSRRHIATTSASILRIAGKTSGCRGLETLYRSNADTMIFWSSSPPSGIVKDVSDS